MQKRATLNGSVAEKQTYYQRNREKVRAYQSKNRERRNYICRNARLRRLYGISSYELDELIAEQNGRCAICNRKFGKTRESLPHVDHCHQLGHVRGILCQQCNMAIGLLGNSPKRMLKVYLYLNQGLA